MGEFNFNTENILTEDEISSLLFESDNNDEDTNDEVSEESTEDTNKNSKETETTEIDPDSLFDGESESVGSDEDIEGDKEDTTKTKDGSSQNFFSSIANAFVEEGIFPDLDEETVRSIKTPEDFRNAVNEQINAGLGEQWTRIRKALDNGVEPDQIKYYENLLYNISQMEQFIEDENDRGEEIRKRLIYQDYLNRGFSQERAEKAVKKTFEDGNDIEEAKEALNGNREFYAGRYKAIRDRAEYEAAQIEIEKKEKAEKIKKTILEDKIEFFGDVNISKTMRQKAFDAISKPVYKDPETGELYTAIQKLEADNGAEFMAKLGLLYALTDGFTSIGNIVDKKVKKEIKKGFSELERKLNNTSRDAFGNLKFTSGVSDEESFIGKGIKLDL